MLFGASSPVQFPFVHAASAHYKLGVLQVFLHEFFEVEEDLPVLDPPTMLPTRTPAGVERDGDTFRGPNRGSGSILTGPIIIVVRRA